MKRSSAYPSGATKILKWSPKDSSSDSDTDPNDSTSVQQPSTSSVQRKVGFTLATLPNGYFHLSGGIFVTVERFKGFLKIHIRVYALEDDGYYTPTKEGIALTPIGWEIFAKKLTKFLLRRKYETLVVENELYLSSSCDTSGVITYKFQRMFKKDSHSLQFFPKVLTLNYINMDLLKSHSSAISKTVRMLLFGPNFCKNIYNAARQLTSLEGTIPPSEGERRVFLDKITIILKDYIERNINDRFFCISCNSHNTKLAHHPCARSSLSIRVFEEFNIALVKIDMFELARQFALARSGRYTLSLDFLNEIDFECVIEKAKELYLEDDICAICKNQAFFRKTLVCNHFFCENCIDKWLERENTCPVCRTNVSTDLNV